MTIHDLLDRHVLTRREVEAFLDPNHPTWAKFDPELGYLLQPFVVQDGVDGAYTFTSLGPHGERAMVNYAARPCRINTYGDSYTQCQQVSDGETWQEVLAAHFGEPVRNFGVGGYGVYQAFRRMVREESTGHGVSYIILNIFGMDDHLRSLDSYRRVRCGDWFRQAPIEMFHSNPWDHVRFDEAGNPVVRRSITPRPEDLYNLCDRDFVHDALQHDEIMHLYLAQLPGGRPDVSLLKQLSEKTGAGISFRRSTDLAGDALRLHHHCGLKSTMAILGWAADFAAGMHKKLMVLLSHGIPELRRACLGGEREDLPLLGFLTDAGIPFADVMESHVREFSEFALGVDDYLARYCIPHYNPRGNQFFAFAVRDAIVRWLDPPPPAFPGPGVTMSFDGYLRESHQDG